MTRAGSTELLIARDQPAELGGIAALAAVWEELLRIRTADRDFVFGPRTRSHHGHRPRLDQLVPAAPGESVPDPDQVPRRGPSALRPDARREFIMKDAYSFHASAESLDEAYNAIGTRIRESFTAARTTYRRSRYRNIGGRPRTFMVLAQSGEDAVVSCRSAATARTSKATSKFFDDEIGPAPSDAIAELHTPGTQSIDDVGKFLGKPTSQLVKTLVFDTDRGAVMVLVRGDREGNEVKIRTTSAPSG
jgi:prolyl-tRNA synthetase